MIGQTLSHYQILEKLGAGGMGEVYRASDTLLMRDVAIKVLPEAFAHDAERVSRFRREAQVLASLHHPNIAAFYELEECGGMLLLVMEFVPGETLAGRLHTRSLPTEEALEICLYVAQALEAAHEKSIVHRDLKPANIKVTPQGTVKVLDFGLAKEFIEETRVDDSATISAPHTLAGSILGTPAYMSPEQARAKPVDRRSDIWSFGCVMYEALTRQKAFGGETSSDSIAAILEREPDLAILGDAVPDNIERLLSRCLQKDQHRRLQDIADARVEIESAITALKTGAHKKPARHGATGWRWGVPWILAALLVAVIAGLSLWILRLFRSTAPPAIVRMAITLAPSEQLSDLTFPAAALSPDGKRLVYVGSRGPRTQLYLRMMDRLDATAIPGTEGGNRPFFSPDGRWLGFFSGGKLKKVTTSGGAPITLCEAVSPRGASWGPGNTIILAPMAGSGLWKVSAEGGSPQAVTTLDATKGEASHRWPDFLPDGKTVIFTIWSGGGWDDAQVAVQNLETGSRTILVRGGTYARYSPTGHMIYARGGVLHAAQFDLARMRLLGFAAPIVEGIMESTSTGVAQFSFSSNGTLVYVPGGLQVVARSLVWVDRSGKVELLTTTPRAYAQPRLSPDGLRIACQVEGATSDLWLFDVPRSTMTRLTSEGHNTWPIWTPAGNRITFASARAGPLNLYWIPSDGSGTAEKLTTSEHPHVPGSWSPDGRELAFVQVNPKTGWDIRVLSLAERQKPRDFLASPFSEDSPVFSPDGHWLAYVSNESGESEIYARPYPGPGSKWPISSGGGTEPVWAKNGRELFFRNGDKIMSAEIIMHPKFSSGKPKVILQGNYERSPVSRANYDVSPDGRRFIMIKESGREAAPTQLNIVFNWFEELKSRARSPRP